ncbi:MAG TPA: HigA family addiction module antitoxin [Burkholderiales bacterium]|nr:HigA family addiction module antitoxin [Burkholderiales bacterium]
MSRKLKPVSPGEMLAEEFLKPLGMSNYRLAKEIGVPAQRIGEILAGKRAITADTDLRLCRFFGLSDGWWLRLQASYDTELRKQHSREPWRRSSPGRRGPRRRRVYIETAADAGEPLAQWGANLAIGKSACPERVVRITQGLGRN